MLIHLSYHISIAMQFCKQMNVSCFMAKFTSASQRQSQSTIWRHKSCPIYLFNDHSQGWMCPLQSVQWLQRLAHHMATKTMKCVHPHMSSISTLAWPVCTINIYQVHVLLGWLPHACTCCHDVSVAWGSAISYSTLMTVICMQPRHTGDVTYRWVIVSEILCLGPGWPSVGMEPNLASPPRQRVQLSKTKFDCRISCA